MMIDLQGLLMKDALRSLAGLECLVKNSLKSFFMCGALAALW